MSFRPSALPTFGRASYPTPSGSVIDMKKAAKVTPGGLVAAQILKTAPGGIIRTKLKSGEVDTFEAEKLLLISVYGADSQIDLTPGVISYKQVLTLEDCKRFEPGTVKYYIALLPAKGIFRPLGDTSIHSYWLDQSKSFDTLEEALEAWEK